MKKNILVFDDDKEMCTELSDILQDEGYLVDVVNNGYDGFLIMKNKNYNVVLLDLKMEGMDGYDVLKRLKSDYPGLNVVVVTGSAVGRKNVLNEILAGPENSQKIEVLQLADHVINKPFDVNNLLSVISGLISKGHEDQKRM